MSAKNKFHFTGICGAAARGWHRYCVLLVCCFLFLPRASACIWDKDTIAAENARFPEVIDLITGNFPRHSREFHEWRIKQTKELLGKTPEDWPLYDDLAVSQHKLGDHLAAGETMATKERLKPGIYETYSNMGTFLIYSGDLPKALGFIKKALSVNPNAHFGREKYQQWLVEWVIAGKPTLTNNPKVSDLDFRPYGFAAFILSKQPIMESKIMTEQLRREAIKGVLGMMRFADFDNPILLEALGDLLILGKAKDNASHLASLSYLHAVQKVDDLAEQARLTRKFDSAKSTIMEGMVQGQLAKELQQGLEKGRKFSASVHEDEVAWIQQGKDASAEFTRKYLTR